MQRSNRCNSLALSTEPAPRCVIPLMQEDREWPEHGLGHALWAEKYPTMPHTVPDGTEQPLAVLLGIQEPVVCYTGSPLQTLRSHTIHPRVTPVNSLAEAKVFLKASMACPGSDATVRPAPASTIPCTSSTQPP